MNYAPAKEPSASPAEKVYGIACPQCASTSWSILETRPAQDAVRRRRQCNGCGTRITTLEMDIDKTNLFPGEFKQLSTFRQRIRHHLKKTKNVPRSLEDVLSCVDRILGEDEFDGTGEI
jgi:transcriptional regulator NrdR family protein